ncbi:7706_t:CDS:2 [Funneliformis mosseae]|uniref:7706_t:CDS:1 n=1 Tax=Funneliformis mosseae TaxID=27381 RepID=A0A9N9G4I9_FUNMO|nr:7706_t:CDS:2 [Funneliformis mosseae]
MIPPNVIMDRLFAGPSTKFLAVEGHIFTVEACSFYLSQRSNQSINAGINTITCKLGKSVIEMMLYCYQCYFCFQMIKDPLLLSEEFEANCCRIKIA